MYNLVYIIMESGDTALELGEPTWIWKRWNNQRRIKGIWTEVYSQIDSSRVYIFADEVSCNTNQKEDGRYASKMILTKRGSIP